MGRTTRATDQVHLIAKRGDATQGFQLSRAVAEELAARLHGEGWTVTIGPLVVANEDASPRNSAPWPDGPDGQSERSS